MKQLFLIALLCSLFLAACGPGQFLGPTITPSPTNTLTLTPTVTTTPSPTSTATPTSTPTPAYLDIIPALAPVVAGSGVPGAAVYDPSQPGPHRVVLLMPSGTAYTVDLMTATGMVSIDWNDYLPSGWSPASLSETEIVVLIGPERRIDLGSTNYNIGPSVTRYRYEVDLDFRVARTGQTLFTTTFKGTTPGPAPSIALYGLTEINGSRFKYADLEGWICKINIKLGCWEIESILPHSTYSVYSLAFSPDGLALASGSNDATMWNIASAEELQTFSDISSGTESVAFSPDGHTLATGGHNNTEISLWDTASGELKQTLTGHTEPVNSIAYSPDGSTIASGSDDDTIILWNAVNGEQFRTLTGHHDNVTSVAFSPDGRILASGGSDTAIILWDVASGEKLDLLYSPAGFVTSVAFSPDGHTLASDLYGALVLWDVASGEQLKRFPDSGGDCIAFSPDGQILASCEYDGSIILWDVITATRLRTLAATSFSQSERTTVSVKSLAFSPDGQTMASGIVDGMIEIWRVYNK